MRYQITGDAMQIELEPGEEVYCEAGKMLWKTGNVNFETRLSSKTGEQGTTGSSAGGFTGELLDTAVEVGKSKPVGESAAFQYYSPAEGPGPVDFSQMIPGELKAIDAGRIGTQYVERDGFFAARNFMDFDIALTKITGAEKFSGSGILFTGTRGKNLTLLITEAP